MLRLSLGLTVSRGAKLITNIPAGFDLGVLVGNDGVDRSGVHDTDYGVLYGDANILGSEPIISIVSRSNDQVYIYAGTLASPLQIPGVSNILVEFSVVEDTVALTWNAGNVRYQSGAAGSAPATIYPAVSGADGTIIGVNLTDTTP